MPVSRSLTVLIDTYLGEARPLLLGTRPDPGNVFIATGGTGFVLKSLSALLDGMAQTYLKGSGMDSIALRAHAYRHIVATAWLKSHPGQFRLVAHLLHDSLATVLANYDHSKPEDGLTAWDEWLSDRLPPPRP